MDKLKGKVAIVTGGSGGIGRAYALRLALLGADVAIIDIDLAVAGRYGEALTAASVMEEVKALGGRSIGVEADLSQQKQAVDAIEKVAKELGRIDILVNNAGGAITPIDRSRSSDTPFEDTEKLFAVNFYTMVHCCQAAAPHLRKQGGAVVNIATTGVDRTPEGGRIAM
jgi:NAD(P)-dependent dehydrogenase (short-subunit alcohol dehydrogenase family)